MAKANELDEALSTETDLRFDVDDWVSILKGVGYSPMFPVRKKKLMDKMLKMAQKDSALHSAMQELLFGH